MIKQKYVLDGEETAVKALVFLLNDDEKLQRFMDLTGVDAGSIRDAAQDPHFLQAVYDYMLSDEPLLLDFAAWLQVHPEHIVAARSQLGGLDSA